jgi:hypothetical protein
VLWIFIALQNPLLLAGSDPANLGSNDKHDNQYTTENDSILVNKALICWLLLIDLKTYQPSLLHGGRTELPI